MARRKGTEMATATEEIVEQTEATDDTESKRKRVDLDKLAAENPHEKVVLSFHVPAEMRVLLRRNAETADVSEAQYVRDIIAREVNYVIPESFNERKRRAGTLTDEEKAELNNKKRENVAALLQQVQENKEAAELLAAMGIDISLLPKPRGARKTKTS